MESELQLSEKEVKKKISIMNIVSVLSLLSAIILAIFLYNSYQNIKSLNNQVNSLKTDVNNMKDIKDTVNLNRYNTFLRFVEHDMEQSIVTEQIVLNKISIFDKGIVVDIGVQPKMVLKYKVEGKFDMQDREVKSMVVDLLDKSKSYYSDLLKTYSGATPAPTWGESSIVVTIQNYEIGTLKNGKFYLKVETE